MIKIKIKTESKGVIKRLGFFFKDGLAIFSIISEDGQLVGEEHLALSKEQAVDFLKKSLEEIEREGE